MNSPPADNHVACEISNADDTSIFGVKRRGDQCEAPTVEGDGSNPPPKNSGPGPSVPEPIPYSIKTSWQGYAFPEKSYDCSPQIFRKSNTPVCKEKRPAPDQEYFQPGQLWMHLYDVSPRTLVHDRNRLIFINMDIRLVFVLSAPSECPVGQVVWCCQFVQLRVCCMSLMMVDFL